MIQKQTSMCPGASEGDSDSGIKIFQTKQTWEIQISDSPEWTRKKEKYVEMILENIDTIQTGK